MLCDENELVLAMATGLLAVKNDDKDQDLRRIRLGIEGGRGSRGFFPKVRWAPGAGRLEWLENFWKNQEKKIDQF